MGERKMKYAMQSSVHADNITASVWTAESYEMAILSFSSGILTGTLSLHIPPSVAQATADAFNEAMEDHRQDEELRELYALYKGEASAGLHKPQEELDAELRDAGRGHLVRP